MKCVLFSALTTSKSIKAAVLIAAVARFNTSNLSASKAIVGIGFTFLSSCSKLESSSLKMLLRLLLRLLIASMSTANASLESHDESCFSRSNICRFVPLFLPTKLILPILFFFIGFAYFFIQFPIMHVCNSTLICWKG